MKETYLKAKHISLFPMKMEHIDDLYEAAKETEIWEWIATKIYNYDDCKKFVIDALKQKEAGNHVPFVVIDNQNSKILGRTRFCSIDRDNRKLEIGFTWYHPQYWGTFLNWECKYLLLKQAFEVEKCIRVEFKTDERNLRSRKAIEKIGAKFEGVIRNERILTNGLPRNTVLFSIINQEWEYVKNHLLIECGKYE